MLVKIQTGNAYNVNIDRDILKNCGDMIKAIPQQKYSRIAIVTDDNVAPLYLSAVRASIESAGFDVFEFIFPNGEASKNMNQAMEIAGFLSDNSFTRRDLIVALGGGVTGDLSGFVASIYQRGIDYVQIPTTFLAAIDSSVGGKTAVNIPQGKNLIGAFWQPRLVICDINTLSTLSSEVFADGTSEAIKYGCIYDASLFELIENGELKEKLAEVIIRCVQIKAEVVALDEKDNAIRQILNFGHTVGHAVEKLSGFAVSHGKAVAIGMSIISKAGEKSGLTAMGTSEKIDKILSENALPISHEYSTTDICKACLGDKKREANSINFIMLSKIGKSFVHPVATKNLNEFLDV